MEEIIRSHFDSQKFIITQKVVTEWGNMFIKIYNPLSPNKEKDDVEHPYEICLDIFLDTKAKKIHIEYLNKCGIHNGGIFFINKVIDFAKKYGYQKISLEDASALYIYAKENDGTIVEEINIPLASFKYLKEGISWYGKLGFTNDAYESKKGDILRFIHQPLSNVVKWMKEDCNKLGRLVGYCELVNQLEDKISFLKENPSTVSDLFTSFEKYLKENCKNNEFLASNMELKQNVYTIKKLTEFFYTVMANRLSLRDLLFGGKGELEYVVYKEEKTSTSICNIC
jgi:hypothetical protein